MRLRWCLPPTTLLLRVQHANPELQLSRALMLGKFSPCTRSGGILGTVIIAKRGIKKHLSEDDPYPTNRASGAPEERSQKGHVESPVTNPAKVSWGEKKVIQVLETNKPACFGEVLLYCMLLRSYQAVSFLSWKSNKPVQTTSSERKLWAYNKGRAVSIQEFSCAGWR